MKLINKEIVINDDSKDVILAVEVYSFFRLIKNIKKYQGKILQYYDKLEYTDYTWKTDKGRLITDLTIWHNLDQLANYGKILVK